MLSCLPPINNLVTIGFSFLLDSTSAMMSPKTINTFLSLVG